MQTYSWQIEYATFTEKRIASPHGSYEARHLLLYAVRISILLDTLTIWMSGLHTQLVCNWLSVLLHVVEINMHFTIKVKQSGRKGHHHSCPHRIALPFPGTSSMRNQILTTPVSDSRLITLSTTIDSRIHYHLCLPLICDDVTGYDEGNGPKWLYVPHCAMYIPPTPNTI